LKNSIWHNLLGQCFIIAMENEANDHTHLLEYYMTREPSHFVLFTF
jgi:hypothetical protein